ncbi:MAG: WGR domain-containing protein [Gemmataceae bacterium]
MPSAKVKAYKYGAAGQPPFSEDYEIVKNCVLQVTEIKTNHNKYYALELHKGNLNGEDVFRVFTHYGRTDDLENNPNAGQKECRYASDLAEAEGIYLTLYKQKTSAKKGYKEVSLASSKIGSDQARGNSSGKVDDETLAKLNEANSTKKKAKRKKSSLDSGVQRLVRYLYDEATNALTSTVNAKITANGIETPIGILTLGQIAKGETILEEMYDMFTNKKMSIKVRKNLEKLSGDFYTAIPHRIGRSRDQMAAAVIDSLEKFDEKQSTLQLMKDMLRVNGEGGSVLFDEEVDAEYKALKCQIGFLDSDSEEYQKIAEYIVKSQIKSKSIKVKNVYTLRRDGEWDTFTDDIDNQRHLFHGSRISNWVGILSRGILLPKIVVSLGVNRTDAGWLGHGIYFGDAACTSSFYTTPGHHNTKFMAVARVALGKMKEYRKITYGLQEPPKGYDSCHGVRRKPKDHSEFDDDEYVIYTTQQQRLEYLVEFTGG